MGYAVLKSHAPFELHIRCQNCERESVSVLDVPMGDNMPRDPDELLDSVFLETVPYRCRHCDSVIGRLFAITGGRHHG